MCTAKNYEGHLFSPGTVLFLSLFVHFCHTIIHVPRREKNMSSGFATRSDTNGAVQL